MASYEISFLSTGAILGTYKADDCRDALDVMARDAGYASFAQIPAECGISVDDIKVERVGAGRRDLTADQIRFAMGAVAASMASNDFNLVRAMGRTGVDRVIGAYCGNLPLHAQKKKRQRAYKRFGL